MSLIPSSPKQRGRPGADHLPRQALLLAGGRGTRIGAISGGRPKSLLPVQDVPVIVRLIGQLRQAGVEHCTVATCHLAEIVEAALGDGGALGLEIDYLREPKPLGTAGCLGLLRRPEHSFYLLNADIVTDLSFQNLAGEHRRTGAAATLAICRHSTALDYGVVDLDSTGRVISYREKPVLESFVAMGIACLEPLVCEQVTPGETISLPEVLARLLAAGRTVTSHLHEGLWCDIGRPDEYERAERLRLPPG
jgi:NDP-sugar pyrophosphorylase family protein